MPLAHGGLVKLVEECGELSQVAAKKIAYPDTDDHPDGKGSLRERLADEIADATAAAWFVTGSFDLDRAYIQERAIKKLKQFHAWSQES